MKENLTDRRLSPHKKVKVGKIVKAVLFYLFATLLALFFLFPIYCLLIKSVMPDSQLIEAPALWPSSFNFEPYGKVFSSEYLWYFRNTLIVCLVTILGSVFASSFTAYGLAKVKFKGRKFVFSLILSTVLLPGVVTSIPLYVIYDKIGWTGTLLPLMIPIWFGGGAMNIFLVRQFIKGIPNSLCEAAVIDGASSFRIYWEIILPTIKPILIYVAVMAFFAGWNDFQGPLMYVSANQSSWTISLALYKNFADANNATNLPNVQMAVIMMIPCLLLFGLFQNQLTEGIATTGIKG
jgi:multiple sugar transport system permease protein